MNRQGKGSLSCALAFLLATGWAVAQTINITGSVVDSTTSTGIPGALVKLAEFPQITTTTVANGAFSLTGVPVEIATPQNVSGAGGVIRVQGNMLTIFGVVGAARVTVDIFTGNGRHVFHADRALSPRGSAQFYPRWKKSGNYYAKVRLDGKEYTVAIAREGQTMFSPGSATASALRKSAAAYNLQVTASGYIAKSVAMPAITGSAGVIKLMAASAQMGVWVNVTPSPIVLDSSIQDNYGAQDVVVDPQRPSDLYAFTCHQGVWKSIDYGVNWTGPINTGANGSKLASGKQWMAAISNTSPASPPTLYTANGASGDMGIWKSTDGGVSWTQYQTFPSTLSQDVYSIDMDPNDVDHLVVGFHERAGIAESTDGGKTWKDVTGNISTGTSWYVSFINTGDPATTRTTWIASPQAGDVGTNRTTDGGAHWTRVESVEHEHGQWQVYQPGGGVVFIAGVNGTQGNGVYRSNDYGVSWTHVGLTRAEEIVVGTPTHLYATEAWPCGPTCTIPTNFEVAPMPGTTGWSDVPTPTAMTYGAKRMTVTFDGNHHIIVAGCWNAGFWRYIEP